MAPRPPRTGVALDYLVSLAENRRTFLDVPPELPVHFLEGRRPLDFQGIHHIRDGPETEIHDTASLILRRNHGYSLFISVTPISSQYAFSLDNLPEKFGQKLRGKKQNLILGPGRNDAFTLQVETDGERVLDASAYHSSIYCSVTPHNALIITPAGYKIENPRTMTGETDLFLEATRSRNTTHGENNLIHLLNKLMTQGIANAGLYAPNLCIHNGKLKYRSFAKGDALATMSAPARRETDRLALAVAQAYASGDRLPLTEMQMGMYCMYRNKELGLTPERKAA